MQVILHIGAHRCATTTFQSYMRTHAAGLRAQAALGFWGPHRTRQGLLVGLVPGAAPMPGPGSQARAAGRVQMNLARAKQKGIRHLIVSDENMMGSLRENLALATLYCGVGERLARIGAAFGGQITDVVLNIRAQDSYWGSVLGYQLARGQRAPSRAALDRICAAPRTWRDVVSDVACALPGARLLVLPYETFGGRPDLQLATATGVAVPRDHASDWRNATLRLPALRAAVCPEVAARLPEGEGRWAPFDARQRAVLAEHYADDMMWLTAGADGLAVLARDPMKSRPGQTPALTDMTEGRPDEHETRRVAQAR